MHIVQILLLPFSWLYGLVVFIRNWAYDAGLFRTYSIPIKSIVVGNLQLGGTGKTPHLAYILEVLASEKVAVISRGYGRKTSGTVLVKADMRYQEVGDEPLELKRKFPSVPIVVDHNRKRAVEHIIAAMPEIKLLLFDDALQHRSIKAGLNILLTTFKKPYTLDYYLPSGSLRDHKIRARDAHLTVISKTPGHLSSSQKEPFLMKSGLTPSAIFTSLTYLDLHALRETSKPFDPTSPVVLLSAIAKPTYLEEAAREKFTVLKHFQYADHHAFSNSDLDEIGQFIFKNEGQKPVILTTEKDASRLYYHPWLAENPDLEIYVWPIAVKECDTNLPLREAVLRYASEK